MRKKLHPDFISYWEKYGEIILSELDACDQYYSKSDLGRMEIIACIFDDEKVNYYYCTLDTNEYDSDESVILKNIKLMAFI